MADSIFQGFTIEPDGLPSDYRAISRVPENSNIEATSVQSRGNLSTHVRFYGMQFKDLDSIEKDRYHNPEHIERHGTNVMFTIGFSARDDYDKLQRFKLVIWGGTLAEAWEIYKDALYHAKQGKLHYHYDVVPEGLGGALGKFNWVYVPEEDVSEE